MVENNFGGLSTKIWSKNLWDYLDIGRLFPKGQEYGNHDSEGIEWVKETSYHCQKINIQPNRTV